MGSSWPDILRITLELVVAVDRLASPSLQVPRQGPLFWTNRLQYGTRNWDPGAVIFPIYMQRRQRSVISVL